MYTRKQERPLANWSKESLDRFRKEIKKAQQQAKDHGKRDPKQMELF